MSTEPFRTILSVEVGEAATAILRGTIRDAAGTALPGSAIGALTLTLYELRTGSILNSRNAVSIKNANGGTIDSNGDLTLTLSPADNAMLTQAVAHETHVALIRWTYNGGADAGWAQVDFRVHNQLKIT